MTMGMPIDQALSRRSMLRSAALIGAGAALTSLPFASRLARAAEAGGEWPQVTAMVERYVSQSRVSGMIAALGWNAAAPTAIARGLEGFTDADPIGPESLFRAYSMTKPVTGMAAMILIDEGKLGLDQKVADYIPEFATMRVAVDPAKGLESVPAKTPIFWPERSRRFLGPSARTIKLAPSRKVGIEKSTCSRRDRVTLVGSQRRSALFC